MSKNLKVIQTVAKVLKVLATIAFVCSIVGVVGCILGILSISGLQGIVIDGKPISDYIADFGDLSIADCYASMAVGIVSCIASIILAKLTQKYLKKELADGTPFTQDGAKKLFNLGLAYIICSVATAAVAGLVLGVMQYFLGNITIDFDNVGSIGTGIGLLLLSAVFGYGAEVRAAATENNATPLNESQT